MRKKSRLCLRHFFLSSPGIKGVARRAVPVRPSRAGTLQCLGLEYLLEVPNHKALQNQRRCAHPGEQALPSVRAKWGIGDVGPRIVRP